MRTVAGLLLVLDNLFRHVRDQRVDVPTGV